MNDVDLEYTEVDYQNLTTFKLFQQAFRPRIQAKNAGVSSSKLTRLVEAKWREFISSRGKRKSKGKGVGKRSKNVKGD